MSTWTHVAGVIRIDALYSTEEFVFKKSLGKFVTWESPEEVWDEFEKYPERFTPTGSEGGIQYSIWKNPKKNYLAKYTVSIFGDLRDYSNIKEIEDWFNSILYEKDLLIRDAIIHITCGDGEESIIKYDYDRADQEWQKRHKDED